MLLLATGFGTRNTSLTGRAR
ncbi:hypothetical protein YPPY13_3917, partial [Yersinia pestis PY-13]